MTYAHIFDIPGPVELYQAAHAEFAKYPTDDMLLHVARSTGDGVEVVEVWTSREAFHDWMGTRGVAALGAIAAAGWTFPEVTATPFDPTGLILPTAGIAV
ncbi:hypothetical protein [Pseudonocardia charpentierae]|uniref:Antibiotic biosynthesis monooxygenase n=1 Tax=Pseudonocardia charpentierae TaxID=3075545 RepID=A0ABU2N670_9PSEU|nr:hypothetical protein [Pseudonocardia sp. DSM 45834]MDT0349430.1 hypothetical protein [Pseudonocardia sp. DSM 45834]